MKRTIFTVAIALIGSITMMMAAPIQVGSSGVYYEITGTAPNLVLTFSGEGEIPSYAYGQAPWFAGAGAITDVIFGEDVEGFGENVFANFTNLKNVTFRSNNPDGMYFSGVGSTPFGNTNISQTTLYVPFLLLSLYENVGIWLGFNAILPISCPTSGTFSGWTNNPDDLIEWAIENGTLTISGTGSIPDYIYERAPWTCNPEAVTNIILGDGIRCVGTNAFSIFSGLKTMTLLSTDPDGVYFCSYDGYDSTPFGNAPTSNATLYAPYEKVEMYKNSDQWSCFGTIMPISCPTSGSIQSYSQSPYDVINWTIDGEILTFTGVGGLPYYEFNTTIPWCCYTQEITQITFSEDITFIGTGFKDCLNLKEMTVYNAEDVLPFPDFGRIILANATLYVPAHLVSAYKDADVWMNFGSIKPIGGCPTSGTISGNTNNPGDVINWSINGTTLTFEGVGRIGDYDSDTMPWACDAREITSIVFGEGITDTGSSFGRLFFNLESVTINNPNGVIPAYQFANSQFANLYVPYELLEEYRITEVWIYFWQILPTICPTSGTLPGNTQSPTDVINWNIENGTMTLSGTGYLPDYSSYIQVPWSCNAEIVTDIIIGDKIGKIGQFAFSCFSNLKTVTVYWENPEEAWGYAFASIDISDVTLYVPAHLVETYKMAPNWGGFNIVASMEQEIEIVAPSNNSIEISWDEVPNAENYIVSVYEDREQTILVYTDTISANSQLRAVAKEKLSIIIPKLDPSTKYYFSLEAVDKEKKVISGYYGKFIIFDITAVAKTVNNRIEIIPNPATDYITLTGLANGVEIVIVDLSGRICLKTNEQTIYVGGLPKGAYLVKIGNTVIKGIKN